MRKSRFRLVLSFIVIGLVVFDILAFTVLKPEADWEPVHLSPKVYDEQNQTRAMDEPSESYYDIEGPIPDDEK